MPQPVLAMLRRTLPATKIFLMYGLTEAFRSTYLSPEELDRRPTSMGKAIPDAEILVLNDGQDSVNPERSANSCTGVRRFRWVTGVDPEDTDRVLRPNPLLPPELGDCERVCYSGDL